MDGALGDSIGGADFGSSRGPFLFPGSAPSKMVGISVAIAQK